MNNIQIETAQNVRITQNIAGIGDRILAFIIDGLLIFIYEMIMMLIFITFHSGDYSSGFELWIVSLIFGLPPFLYHLLMETFNDGQSIGKAALKIRVVKSDGTPPHFSNYLIRWLFRILEITLTSGGLAIFVILLKGKGQRLGDIAAKTTVISEKQHIGIKNTLMVDIPEDYIPAYPQVTILTDKDIQTIKNLYIRFKKNRNNKTIETLAGKISSLLEIEPQESSEDFIQRVLKDYNYYTQQ